MNKCEFCSNPFESPVKIVNKRFCSLLCRRRARNDRERISSGGSTSLRVCAGCNNTISPLERRGRIYCSKECKNKGTNWKIPSEKEALLKFTSIMKGHMSKCEGTCTRYVKDVPVLIDNKIVPCLAAYNLFIKDGYPVLSYKGNTLRIHRIVYLLLKGILSNPETPIDHINQNKLDNRIENLRLATVGKNNANKKLKPNKSGYRGVYPHFDKWIAQVSIDGKVKALGRFITKEEAALAYNQAALELWGNDAEVNELVSL